MDAPEKKPALGSRAERYGFSALAEKHGEYMRIELERQRFSRLERAKWREVYQTGTITDDISPENDWLAKVHINLLRPNVDMIVGEMLRRKLYPKVAYIGRQTDKEFHHRAEMRNLQSRSIMAMSHYHRHRSAAIKDAVLSGDGWMFWGVRQNAEGAPRVQGRHVRWENILCDSVNVDANGGIDDCRFVARFSLVEQDTAIKMFPRYENEIRELSRGLPGSDRSAIDNYWENVHWQDLIRSGEKSSAVLGGDHEGRNFVAYGVFYYRDAAGALMKYPFVTDRGISKVCQVGEAIWPYSHNMFPFLRWIDCINSEGVPFSKIAQGKVGIERVVNYGFRRALEKMDGSTIIFNDRAIPLDQHGAPAQSAETYTQYLMAMSRRPHKVLHERELNSIRIDSSGVESDRIINAVQAMISMEGGSGASVHPSITGQTGGSTPTSGIALREHINTMIASHPELLQSDQLATERAGEMNLYFLRDFDEIAPNSVYVGENGAFEPFPQYMLPSADGSGGVDARAIATGDFGVYVEPIEVDRTFTQQEVNLHMEFIKNLGQNMPKIPVLHMIAMGKKLGFSEDDVRMVASEAIKEGVYVPDRYLSLRDRELRDQTQKDMQEKGAKQEQMTMEELLAAIEEKRSKANLQNAKAAEALAGDGMPPKDAGAAAGAAAAGGGAGAPPDLAAALAENASLREQNERMAAQLKAAGAQ